MVCIDVEYKERIVRKEGGGVENFWNGLNYFECLCEDGWIGYCENVLRVFLNVLLCVLLSLGVC